MAKSRTEKNKRLYDDLDEEMKENKISENYEEKLKSVAPELNERTDEEIEIETKKEIKEEKKNEVVVAPKEEKKLNIKLNKKKKSEEIYEDNLVSFTDKLSVEEILRSKIEQQEKLKKEKFKIAKKGPNSKNYPPEKMQKRIRQDKGVDVRKEVNLNYKQHKWVALVMLIIGLVIVSIVGIILIIKTVKI